MERRPNVRKRYKTQHIYTWLGVAELEVFIWELAPVDRLATGAIVVGEVASLEHKLRNHTAI
jgi:hypothetical protein